MHNGVLKTMAFYTAAIPTGGIAGEMLYDKYKMKKEAANLKQTSRTAWKYVKYPFKRARELATFSKAKRYSLLRNIVGLERKRAVDLMVKSIIPEDKLKYKRRADILSKLYARHNTKAGREGVKALTFYAAAIPTAGITGKVLYDKYKNKGK